MTANAFEEAQKELLRILTHHMILIAERVHVLSDQKAQSRILESADRIWREKAIFEWETVPIDDTESSDSHDAASTNANDSPFKIGHCVSCFSVIYAHGAASDMCSYCLSHHHNDSTDWSSQSRDDTMAALEFSEFEHSTSMDDVISSTCNQWSSSDSSDFGMHNMNELHMESNGPELSDFFFNDSDILSTLIRCLSLDQARRRCYHIHLLPRMSSTSHVSTRSCRSEIVATKQTRGRLRRKERKMQEQPPSANTDPASCAPAN